VHQALDRKPFVVRDLSDGLRPLRLGLAWRSDVKLTREEFTRRLRERFYDPPFDQLSDELARIVDTAWVAYDMYHKSPRTRRAGRGFSDPEFALPIEWLETRSALQRAQKHQKNPRANSRILLINGSTRSDQTCPGEMSKTFRLAKMAEEIFARAKGIEVDLLDLSRLASEYGRTIYPCKACVSPRCRSVTGRAPVIRTMPWDRSTTGWRTFIRVGWRRMES